MTIRKDLTTAKSIGNSIKKNRMRLFPGRGGQQKCYLAYGADRDKWSRWELGKATPTDKEQRKLARFFGITLAELRDENVPVVIAGADGINRQVESFLVLVADLAALAQVVVSGRYQHETDELTVMVAGAIRKYKDDIGIADTVNDTSVDNVYNA